MAKKCCEFLLHEIVFYKDSIRPCCSFSIEGDITPFINNVNGQIEQILFLSKILMIFKMKFIISIIIQGGKQNEV